MLIQCHSKRLVLAFGILLLVSVQTAPSAFAQRPTPPAEPHSEGVHSRDYCESDGGSTFYEEIDGISYTIIEGETRKIEFTVDIYILNPNGCEGGEPCPEYDLYPEHINVWVDWYHDGSWETAEQVMDIKLDGYNINEDYTGIMQGVVQVPLPAVTDLEHMMRVQLIWGPDEDDPEDPCLESWEWGDVEDFTIRTDFYRVAELEVKDGNLIVEMGFFPYEIWQEDFDADCGRVTIIDDYESYPLCIPSSHVGKKAEVAAMVAACDAAAPTPWLETHWSVSNAAGTVLSQGASALENDWDVLFEIDAPNEIGIYDFAVTCNIASDYGQTATLELGKRKLYVTYDEPDNEDPMQLPKKIWYETGCTWADGEDDLIPSADKIRQGIFDTDWIYGHYHSGGGYDEWDALLEDPNGNACCFQFTDVLYNVCRVLGWYGVFAKVEEDGSFGHGFVTKTHVDGVLLESPDIGCSGNVRPCNTGAYDRWKFTKHSLLEYQADPADPPEYHDATFNQIYDDPLDPIEWNLTDDTSPHETDGPYEIVQIGGYSCDPRNWIKYEYCTPAPLAEGATPTLLADQQQMLVWSRGSPFSIENVEFETLDADSNDIAEALVAIVEAEILVEGGYLITGTLSYDDEFITRRPSAVSEAVSADYLEGEPDTLFARLQFSGEDIYDYGQGGPYRLRLFAYDSTSVVDSLPSTTPPLSYTDFGEYMAEIDTTRESVWDLDADNKYDVLRIAVDILGRDAGNYVLLGAVLGDSSLITKSALGVSVVPGPQSVDLDFSGIDIRKSMISGPYLVNVTLADSTGVMVSSRKHVTEPYTAGQFDRSFMEPIGAYSDTLLDTDEDGDYDVLRASLDVRCQNLKMVTLKGWLNERDGRNGGFGPTITVASDSALLVPGPQTLEFDFKGSDINRRGVDGPYVLAFVEAVDESLEVFDHLTLGYETQGYFASEFDEGPSVISYLGSFTDAAIDTSDNGLAEFLDVSINVVSSRDARLLANMDLHDKSGRYIATGTGFVDASEGIPASMPIRFDGRYVYGNLRDGPYEIRDLYVYYSGDVTNGVRMSYLGETAEYDNEDFEPAAVIAGIVESAPHVRAVGASVRSPEFADFTDENGEYRLIYLSDDTTTVRASFEGVSDWTVVLNGEFIYIADSMTVEVAIGEIDELVFLKVNPTDIPDDFSIPSELRPGLHQNAPNPFSPSTEIMFVVSAQKPVQVQLRIYDPSGRLVRTLVDDLRDPGAHGTVWDGRNDRGESVNAGVYFYRLDWDGKIQSRRMILVK